jgi:hypothetical protein
MERGTKEKATLSPTGIIAAKLDMDGLSLSFVTTAISVRDMVGIKRDVTRTIA